MSEIPKGLVERIEAATEGSRELDREIVTALYGEPIYDAEQPWGAYWNIDGCDVEEDDIPRYTTSIDVAMTLIPDDATGWSLNNDRLENEALVFRTGDGVIGRGNASSSALALCCASLRAHMTQENPNGSQ